MSNESVIKNGKMPASMKKEADTLSAYRDSMVLDGSIVDMDPALKAWLDENGFVARWLNAKKYTKDGGFNNQGWKALRMSDVPEVVRQSSMFSFGESPEGYMLRNDLLLGIRTSEKNAQHKTKLQERANRAVGAEKAKEQASNLRQRLGKGVKVHEGYEENE